MVSAELSTNLVTFRRSWTCLRTTRLSTVSPSRYIRRTALYYLLNVSAYVHARVLLPLTLLRMRCISWDLKKMKSPSSYGMRDASVSCTTCCSYALLIAVCDTGGREDRWIRRRVRSSRRLFQHRRQHLRFTEKALAVQQLDRLTRPFDWSL